jgi:zinc transport system substrate-binding protein
MKKAVLFAPALAVSVWLASCPRREPAEAGDRLRVAVSILPQAYFVERVGGEHVKVDVLVGPGQQPHTFDPTVKQMRRLGRARVYFRIGVPFEQTLCRKLASAHTHLRVVDVRKGIDLQPVAESHHHGEEAGEDRHGHPRHEQGPEGELDPHIWLSPPLAKIQAQTICEVLCQADRAHARAYRRNLAALQGDLDGLHARIAKDLAPLKGRSFYVLHPAFGYFAAAYGLKQKAVQTEGKAPGLRHIKELLQRARADGVHTIFVQPQFSDRQARTIAAELGGSVVPLDPLARDYLRNMEDISRKIRQALAPKTP